MAPFNIQNERLSVKLKLTGAELCSYIDKQDGVEHMWQADSAYWPRHAPILFPCIGESKGGKITVDGADYPMGRHGFTRQSEFKVLLHKKDSVELILTANEQTKTHYPFDFELVVSYRLNGSTLRQDFEVRNVGDQTMGFQLGGHPAFAVPFQAGEQYSDYQISFDRPVTRARHLLSENGLYTGETRPFLENGSCFGLEHDLFNEDAIVLKDIESKSVWIQRNGGGKRLKVDYEGFPHLGIWSVPGADYVCLEPWIGCADNEDQPKDFWSKSDIVKLDSGKTFEAGFSISLDQYFIPATRISST